MQIGRIEEKCNSCMLCVQDCAAGVWRDIDGVPEAVDPKSCNRCSHCLAVCPKAAIVHSGLNKDDARKVYRELLDAEVYSEIAVSRRSIRHYKNKPVSVQAIESLIDVARYSPTASNSQHVAYTVITDRQVLEDISDTVFDMGRRVYEWSRSKRFGLFFAGAKIHPALGRMIEKYIEPMDYFVGLKQSGRDLILHGAPALIIMHAPALSFFGADNCGIAAANISNLAHARGLGSCYIGFLTLALRFHKGLRQKIQLPKGRKAHACLVIGYPAYRHRYTVSRKSPEVQWI